MSIRQMIEDSSSSSTWEPGTITTHPDGYKVEIIDGQFYGTYGLSNFWTWKRLDTGVEEDGYGW